MLAPNSIRGHNTCNALEREGGSVDRILLLRERKRRRIKWRENFTPLLASPSMAARSTPHTHSITFLYAKKTLSRGVGTKGGFSGPGAILACDEKGRLSLPLLL